MKPGEFASYQIKIDTVCHWFWTYESCFNTRCAVSRTEGSVQSVQNPVDVNEHFKCIDHRKKIPNNGNLSLFVNREHCTGILIRIGTDEEFRRIPVFWVVRII